MNTPVVPKQHMKVPEFFPWAETQPDGRFELVDGIVIAKPSERLRHNLIQFAVARALDDAVRAAGLLCTVRTSGAGIAIGDDTVFDPDVSVQCEQKLDLEAMLLATPLIVVEIASSSKARFSKRLVDCFSLPSVQHYLVIVSENHVIVHHRRSGRDTLDTRIARPRDDITLDPPGMSVSVAVLLGSSPAGGAEVADDGGSDRKP
jgi:Uma2 family endonuclease